MLWSKFKPVRGKDFPPEKCSGCGKIIKDNSSDNCGACFNEDMKNDNSRVYCNECLVNVDSYSEYFGNIILNCRTLCSKHFKQISKELKELEKIESRAKILEDKRASILESINNTMNSWVMKKKNKRIQREK
jgi:hypothetical protein